MAAAVVEVRMLVSGGGQNGSVVSDEKGCGGGGGGGYNGCVARSGGGGRGYPRVRLMGALFSCPCKMYAKTFCNGQDMLLSFLLVLLWLSSSKKGWPIDHLSVEDTANALQRIAS